MLISFIGGGNMATALISGLVNPPRAHIRIRVSDLEFVHLYAIRVGLDDVWRVPTTLDIAVDQRAQRIRIDNLHR